MDIDGLGTMLVLASGQWRIIGTEIQKSLSLGHFDARSSNKQIGPLYHPPQLCGKQIILLMFYLFRRQSNYK